MHIETIEETGPIDYLLVEWPGRQPNGEVAPYLVDLVDRGLIRILDLAFLPRTRRGTSPSSTSSVGTRCRVAVFEGAASRLLDERTALPRERSSPPGTSAALLIFENAWAGPFAAAVRRSGGQGCERPHPDPVDVAALDAAEAA